MSIRIITAFDDQQGIGFDNKLPWHNPLDLELFKTLTLGQNVVMGKRTWLSLGKPLVNRRNIVVSSSLANTKQKGVEFCKDLSRAIEITDNDFVVIGGAKLYESCLDKASVLYVSRIPGVYQADTWFPTITSEWSLFQKQHHAHDDHAFDFEIHQRLIQPS